MNKLQLGLALWKLERYLKGGPVNGFDPKVSVKKGVMSFLRMVAAAALLGVVGAMLDAEAVKALFAHAGVPDGIAAFIAMASVAGAKALANAVKHIQLDVAEIDKAEKELGGGK